ncbi:unnamed protein product [Sphagnum balticum]
MAVPLAQTFTTSVHSANCISYMNLPCKALELRSSSSQAFRLRTCTSRFRQMKAYGSSSPSSATTTVHAHVQQEMEHPIQSEGTKFQQVFQDFVIPKFIPPFSHNRNPLEEEANQVAHQWYHHYFASTIFPETFEKIKKGNTHIIPISVHPTAELSRLEWALEFYLFMFVIDDVVERKTRTSSLEDLEELFLELMVLIISSFPQYHILQENLNRYFSDELDRRSTKDFAEKVLARAMQHSKTDFDKHKTSAICSAFSNLLSRATSEMPEEWSLRFTRILQEAMLAQFLEARYLLEKKDPSLSMYLSHRKEFGYMDASLSIIDYVEGVFLPNTLHYSSPMQQLLQASGDVICWHNDIYSFQKELVNGETHNLVIMLSKEKKISYNKAAELVNQMILDKIEEVHSAITDLRVLTQSNKEITVAQGAAIERYIMCCTSFISSSHEFHTQSSRFHVV